jgi:hypothetical protein
MDSHASGAHGDFMVGSFTIIQNGQPMQKATVNIFDQSIDTDDSGKASFEHVKQGKHTLIVVKDGKQYTQEITISKPDSQINLTTQAQEFNAATFAQNNITNTAASARTADPFQTGIALFSASLGILLTLVLILAVVKKKVFPDIYLFKILSLRKAATFAVLTSIAMGMFGTFFQMYSTGSRASTLTYTTTIPIPSNVIVIEDDRVATVMWNKQLSDWIDEHDEDTSWKKNADGTSERYAGYFIRWGKKGAGFPSKAVTRFEAIQLQPLDPSAEYELELHTIDVRGNISAPVTSFTLARQDAMGAVITAGIGSTFKSNSTRVSGYENTMTGFFDNFNIPAGPFDELLWGNAYIQANPIYSGQFVNTQFHSHNQITSWYDDRSSNVSKPKYIFDFRNREGTIVFDQDGSFSRDKWYIDIMAESSKLQNDIIGSGGEKSPVTKLIRINQNASIEITNDDGDFTTLNASNCGWGEMCGGADEINISPIPNVRVPWVIKVQKISATQMRVKVFIRGKLINDRTVNMGNKVFDRGYVLWSL